MRSLAALLVPLALSLGCGGPSEPIASPWAPLYWLNYICEGEPRCPEALDGLPKCVEVDARSPDEPVTLRFFETGSTDFEVEAEWVQREDGVAWLVLPSPFVRRFWPTSTAEGTYTWTTVNNGFYIQDVGYTVRYESGATESYTFNILGSDLDASATCPP